MRVGLAAAAGFVIGFVVTLGGALPRPALDTSALASDIPTRLVGAARALDGYSATFRIVELNWTTRVQRRTFNASVSFRAPEMFRAVVRDTTTYPSEAWPRNDLSLVTDGSSWQAVGPDPCPAASLPECPHPEPVERSIVGRPPFDSQTAMPTDVIVPMTVLAASDRVSVVGEDRVGEREAVVVQMDHRDATPLFAYLRFLGSWRPFHPDDRVLVWLDSETWFPLRYSVHPSAGEERAAWAASVGLPAEPPGRPVFVATVAGLSTSSPPKEDFDVEPVRGSVDQGFRDSSLPEVGAELGSSPIAPRDTLGLSLVRTGSFAGSPSRHLGRSVLAYASGLAWLTVTQVSGWGERRAFGVGPFAEPVSLGAAGTGYYEPASAQESRRIAFHTSSGELLLATNLPRSSLLRVAASLPARGLAQPRDWRVGRWMDGEVESGLSPEEAVGRAGFEVLLPQQLPAGYRAVSGQIVKDGGTVGVTIVFRRPGAELGGEGLRLHQALGQDLPPPRGEDQMVVTVRGSSGRWSPDEGVLEWVEAGVYRSISGADLGLGDLLRVAGSLRAP